MGKIGISRDILEGAALFIVLSFVVFWQSYAPFGGRIGHEYPTILTASDPNTRAAQIDYIIEDKRYFYAPPYFFGETRNNIAIAQPPDMLLSTAALSIVSGLKAYDLLYFLEAIASLGLAMGFYLLFRYELKERLLSFIVPLLLSFPIEGQYLYGRQIGFVGNFETVLFIPFLFIAFFRFREDASAKNAFLFALVMSFQFFFHATTALLMAAFFASYLAIGNLAQERFRINLNKALRLGLPFLILLLLILPFLPLFLKIWVGTSPLVGNAEIKAPPWEPDTNLLNFLNPAYYLFFMLGSVAILMKRGKSAFFLYLNAFFLLLLFVLPSFGIGTYYVSIRMRYFMYAYAYVLVGFGILLLKDVLASVSGMGRSTLEKLAVLAVAFFILYQAYHTPLQPYDNPYTKDSYDFFTNLDRILPEGSVSGCIDCFTQGEQIPARRYVPYIGGLDVPSLLRDGNANITLLLFAHSDAAPRWDGFMRVGLYEGRYANRPYHFCDLDYLIIRASNPQNYENLKLLISRLDSKNTTVAASSNYGVAYKLNKGAEKCV